MQEHGNEESDCIACWARRASFAQHTIARKIILVWIAEPSLQAQGGMHCIPRSSLFIRISSGVARERCISFEVSSMARITARRVLSNVVRIQDAARGAQQINA